MKTDCNTPFHYWQSGLDYIQLFGGVEWQKIDDEDYYTISDLDNLHTLIANELLTSPHPLCGQELRFLRSLLGMSQSSLAENMGVSRDAIAKAEADKHKALSGQMDRLVRLLYLLNKMDPETFAKMKSVMDDIAEEDYQRELKLKHSEDHWQINLKAA